MLHPHGEVRLDDIKKYLPEQGDEIFALGTDFTIRSYFWRYRR
jgi:hypothetical protein